MSLQVQASGRKAAEHRKTWVLSIPCFSSLASSYKLRFSDFLSTLRSWENLHLLPFPHWPCLKNEHNTDFGSTPMKRKKTNDVKWKRS